MFHLETTAPHLPAEMSATRKRANKTSNQSGSPSVTAKKASKERFFCPICEEEILDATGKKLGQDLIQCDGKCATWLHRRCAGLSKDAFKVIIETRNANDPFYCPTCRLDLQENEIKSLRDLVTNLSSHISMIADEIAALKSKALQTCEEPACDRRSYASVVDAEVRGSQNEISAKRSSNSFSQKISSKKPNDRKYNVLFFGLKEPVKGTPRFLREEKEHENVCRTLTSIDPSISQTAIRDCFRLGKCNPDKNRPLMVKFVRSHDATLVLSKRKNLVSQPGISLKPDLPPAQRKVESLLLKERRSLINSGVAKNDIRIKGNYLLVKQSKHASVVGDTLQLQSAMADTTQMSQLKESPISESPELRSTLPQDKINASRFPTVNDEDEDNPLPGSTSPNDEINASRSTTVPVEDEENPLQIHHLPISVQ